MAKSQFHYVGGSINYRILEEALDFLIGIEPEPMEFERQCAEQGIDSNEAYKDILARNASSIDCANAAMKQYGRQIIPPNVEAMQDKFYEIINSQKYRGTIAYSCLNRAWANINGWQP